MTRAPALILCVSLSALAGCDGDDDPSFPVDDAARDEGPLGLDGGPDGDSPDGGPGEPDLGVASDDPDAGTPMAGSCPPAGPYGSAVGEVAPPVTLYDCDGGEVSLHALCDAPVSWVMEYAEWCPTCRTFARDDVERIYQASRDRGLAAFVVVSADASYGAPTAELCAEVRDRYELTMPVLYDPTGAFQSGLDVASNSVNVLFTGGMRIEWKGRYQDAEVEGHIDDLFAGL